MPAAKAVAKDPIATPANDRRTDRTLDACPKKYFVPFTPLDFNIATPSESAPGEFDSETSTRFGSAFPK
jgi:hypothetical protein